MYSLLTSFIARELYSVSICPRPSQCTTHLWAIFYLTWPYKSVLSNLLSLRVLSTISRIQYVIGNVNISGLNLVMREVIFHIILATGQ